jgi:GNAT superfamily N-acetyltransferase
MAVRIATRADIPQIQFVRNAVKENMLSDPALVPDKDVEDYMFNRGRGWVYEAEGRIVGFAIVSLIDKNVWALFVEPGFDKKGAGRKLHDAMMDWYFEQEVGDIWLGTAPGTRAEQFYRKAGWRETGMHGKGEIKFEMSAAEWKMLKN